MARKRSRKLFADRDSDFACNARNFAQQIANDPQRYHLAPEDAEQMVRVVETFRAALFKCANPRFRNQDTTGRKNSARAEAERVLRPYANLIRINKKISTSDKAVILIEERPERLHKRPCPPSRPLLRLARGNDSSATSGGRHRIAFGYQHKWTLDAPRPPGAARIELFLELFPPNTRLPSSPDDRAYLRSI
jgi:hypothetical protein